MVGSKYHMKCVHLIKSILSEKRITLQLRALPTYQQDSCKTCKQRLQYPTWKQNLYVMAVANAGSWQGTSTVASPDTAQKAIIYLI